MTLTPDGKSHRVFRLLAEHPCTHTDIVYLMGAAHRDNLRRKLFYVIHALKKERMIGFDGKSYWLLPRGLAELERLEAARSEGVANNAPSVAA